MEIGTRAKRLLARILIGSVVLAGAGWLFEGWAERRDNAAHPPPGRMVSMDGGRVHLLEMGSGEPAVVLDAPLGGSVLQWGRIQPELARDTRVIAFDRRGLGWSDPAIASRDSDSFAREMNDLLEAAGIRRPFIYVGQSLGATNALVYAAKYPEEVAGLVLVDPVLDEQLPATPLEEQADESRALLRVGGWMSLAARFGLVRLYVGTLKPRAFVASSDKLGSARNADMSRRLVPHRIETVAEERAGFRESVLLAKEAQLPRVPLVILTGMKGPSAASKSKAHGALAKSNPAGGLWIGVLNAGHDVHLEQPQSVIQAVRELLNDLGVKRARRSGKKT